jgi:hypothetical protein
MALSAVSPSLFRSQCQQLVDLACTVQAWDGLGAVALGFWVG